MACSTAANGIRYYWERVGKARRQAAVFLPWGAGRRHLAEQRRAFDPARYDGMLSIQRGCWQLDAIREIAHNTT